MFRWKVATIVVTLFCETTFCHSVFKRQKNFYEKPKQCNPYYVEHENSTDYILNHNSLLLRQLAKTWRPPPYKWDWRHEGVVGPVKNQKTCAACWAFSIVACIESQLAIWKDIKVILSEQFLIDCVNYGKCDAPKCGNYSLLKLYCAIVTELGGVLAYSDYRPYSASARTCTYSKPPPYPQPIVGFSRVKNNEDVMVEHIYNIGPLSAGINSKSMAEYQGNYIDQPTEEQCSSRNDDGSMNHAVLIVGYNVHVDARGRSIPYWIIKNSWGEQWGDQGFYYLVRGRNACGIANDVSYAIVN